MMKFYIVYLSQWIRIAKFSLKKFDNKIDLVGALNCPDGQVVNVLAFWCKRYGSSPKSVKLTQCAIDSLLMQPCTGDGLCQLTAP